MVTSKSIRKKILVEFEWVKKVVESAQTADHLVACKKIANNWSAIISQNIRDCYCPFYKCDDIRKTIESYRRTSDEINRMIAKREVEISNSKI